MSLKLPSMGRLGVALALATALAATEARAQCVPQDPARAILDINTTTADSEPSQFTDLGGVALFRATDATHDIALWRTDGTAAGTELVLDMGALVPWREPRLIVRSGSRAFIHAQGMDNDEIWVSDGTTAGTVLVKDLGVTFDPPDNFMASSTRLFFSLHAGDELWTSDGTTAGTIMLRDFSTGTTDDAGVLPLTIFQDQLVFSVLDDAIGSEPWISDGSAAGTRVLEDIWPGPESSLRFASAAATSSQLFIAAHDAASGLELRVTDASLALFSVAHEILPGAAGPSSMQRLTAVGDIIVFVALTPTEGDEPWRSDGSDAGTYLLRDIEPGGAGSGLTNFLVSGTRVLFHQRMGGPVVSPVDSRIFVSDGTIAGTVDLGIFTVHGEATESSGVALWPVQAAIAGGWLLSGSREWAVTGTELIVLDGTPAGSADLDLRPGFPGVWPESLASFGAGALLSGELVQEGREPWISDGTLGGTRLVTDMNTRSHGSAPGGFADLAGVALFHADDGVTGRELWRSDGSAAGTYQVADIVAGSSDGLGTNPIVVVGAQAFLPGTPFGGLLSVTDGTPSGTRQVTGRVSTQLDLARPFDGRLLFVGWDPITKYELWISDGTDVGTTLVHEITTAPFPDLEFESLVVSGNRAFFSVRLGSANDVWVTDGTDAGTQLVQAGTDTMPVGPESLVPWRDGVAFVRRGRPNGDEAWFSDGTAAGTVPLGGDVRDPRALTGPYVGAVGVAGGQLVFANGDAAGDEEPWACNGVMPCEPLMDISAFASSAPETARAFGGSMIFTASTPAAGREPWITDGTLAGTTQLADCFSGPDDAVLSGFAEGRGVALFGASRGPSSAVRAWLTDGTPAGTRDLGLGLGGEGEVAVVGGRFFLGAWDAAMGVEPHVFDADSDGDGLADSCDPAPTDPANTDSDSDGVLDALDNCAAQPNAAQEDEDADGFGDACDVCPSIPDPAQADRDGDSIGDGCDLDADGDGVPRNHVPGTALDCDDSDPASPILREVSDVRATAWTGGVNLTWTDESPIAGPSVLYDVLSGPLGPDMLQAAPLAAGAQCWWFDSDVPSVSLDLPSSAWLLVRAGLPGTCGEGTLGSSWGGANARVPLESIACP